jgi:Right handed beta helix region
MTVLRGCAKGVASTLLCLACLVLLGAGDCRLAAGEDRALASSGPLVIANQHHQVYSGLTITSGAGQDCIQITNSTDITIDNSSIGPCGGNGINISGGSRIQIYDSYIHTETKSPGCCDHNDGVLIENAADVTIRGNVIAYGESNVEAPQGVTGLSVLGNFLLNPRGPYPRGQNVQAWNTTKVVVVENYALSSTDTSKYLYPDDQEDSINFGEGAGFVARDNYITGGHSPSGCGLIADDGANSARFVGNRLVDTGECGIGIASGKDQLVMRNRIINRNPVAGGGNTALYVWSQYKGGACGPTNVSYNIATEIRADGTQSGFWNGGGCGPLTMQGNVWDQAAEDRLTPVETKLPPPLIPPQPHRCVISSPYSTQTAWPACQ